MMICGSKGAIRSCSPHKKGRSFVEKVHNSFSDMFNQLNLPHAEVLNWSMDSCWFIVTIGVLLGQPLPYVWFLFISILPGAAVAVISCKASMNSNLGCGIWDARQKPPKSEVETWIFMTNLQDFNTVSHHLLKEIACVFLEFLQESTPSKPKPGLRGGGSKKWDFHLDPPSANVDGSWGATWCHIMKQTPSNSNMFKRYWKP